MFVRFESFVLSGCDKHIIWLSEKLHNTEYYRRYVRLYSCPSEAKN